MANKELLLTILVMILVGISIAVAVQIISGSEMSPNRSAILQGINEAIGRSRAYYERPEVMGGGANSFSEISFEDLYLDSSTSHGDYVISDRTHSSFTLTGMPSGSESSAEYYIIVIYKDSVNWVQN